MGTEGIENASKTRVLTSSAADLRISGHSDKCLARGAAPT